MTEITIDQWREIDDELLEKGHKNDYNQFVSPEDIVETSVRCPVCGNNIYRRRNGKLRETICKTPNCIYRGFGRPF
jgi:predicted RNA-binding Zn-ribbon protein involved in translation (DUF1610 family)